MSVRLHDAQKDRGAVWGLAAITFPRAGLPLMLALFGCAPAGPPASQPQATVTVPGGPAYATVAAVRPIPGLGAAANDPDAAILPAMGVSAAVAATTAASSEIVVRTDDGETLSVVQPNVTDLAPGERVLVVPGGEPRLVPAPPAS